MLAVKTTRKSAVALPKELAVRPSQSDKPILPYLKHHHPNAKPNNKPSSSQQLSISKASRDIRTPRHSARLPQAETEREPGIQQRPSRRYMTGAAKTERRGKVSITHD